MAPNIRNTYSSEGDRSLIDRQSSLFIELAASRFSYALRQTDGGIFRGDYRFQDAPDEAVYRSELRAIVAKDELLQRSYQGCFAAVHTAFELLPAPFFNAANLPVGCGYAAVDDVVVVYENPAVLADLGLPPLTVLPAAQLLLQERRKNGAHVLVLEEGFYVMMVRNNAVQLLNFYPYQSVADFMYFLLAAVRDCDFDRQTEPVFIHGMLTSHSAIAARLQQFFGKVELLQQPQLFVFNQLMLCAS